MGSISYCIQYLARLAIGQKSNTHVGDVPKKSHTSTYLLTDQALVECPYVQACVYWTRPDGSFHSNNAQSSR